MLLLYSILAGLLIGRVVGGGFGALSDLELRWWWVALGGLVFQLVLFSAPVAERVGAAGPILYVGSSVAVFGALLRNLRLTGFPLIALGAGLNLVAIVANGGYMPSSPDAWLTLNGVAALPSAEYTNSSLIGPSTLLPFLGDIFVLPRPLPLANVFSIGDVLVGVGAAWCLIGTMTARAGTRAGGSGSKGATSDEADRTRSAPAPVRAR